MRRTIIGRSGPAEFRNYALVAHMKLFKRNGTALNPLVRQRFANEYYEKDLQDWIFRNPHTIADDLLMVGREIQTGAAKRIDLLGLDKEGNTVIIELKRGEAPRDLVIQINDYLTTVEQWDERELELRTKRQPRTLEKEFRQKFNCEPPPKFNRRPRAVVVVESVDEMTVKMFKRQGIAVLQFSYLKSTDEEYILVQELTGAWRSSSAAPEYDASVESDEAPDGDDDWRATPDETEKFFRYYDEALAPLLRNIFSPSEGWIPKRTRRWMEARFFHRDWNTQWEGFSFGFDYSTDNRGRQTTHWIGLTLAPRKHSQPLLAELQRDEGKLRNLLGPGFSLGRYPHHPIWEDLDSQLSPDKVAKRMAQGRVPIRVEIARVASGLGFDCTLPLRSHEIARA